MNLIDLWKSQLPNIQAKIGKASYETWFTAIKVCERNPSTLVIEAPDDFYKNWISDHYAKDLLTILAPEAPADFKIVFSVNEGMVTVNSQHNLETITSARTEKKAPTPTLSLNKRFTFENFVVGASNRFVCAASLAVAESPAKAYNPLFIYGHVGLGKTHILQAITHKINQLHPQLKMAYMSSEKFTNELIDAIRHRSTTAFRKKYRDIDVLLLDDIQFIAGKESTQEEFFHTFNNLHNNNKQIIITSDRPPKEIKKLEERLSSRFSWGLIADIQPPDFETRVAILKKKLEFENVIVPEDIIYFIAEQIKTNIRELEGALIRVTAYALLEEKPISLDLAKFILKDMVRETKKIISVEMIQQEVAKTFNITLQDLQSKRRTKNIVFPRQVAMYLSRELTTMSLPEIGSAFGGRDHTTVLHSYKKIASIMIDDVKLKTLIPELTTALKQ